MPILRGVAMSVGFLKAGPETEVEPLTAFELNTLDAPEAVFPPLILARKGVVLQARARPALNPVGRSPAASTVSAM